MLLLLNLLYYYSILPNTDEIEYHNKKIRISKATKTLNTNEHSWYFAQIPRSMFDDAQFSKLNVQYNHDNIISSDWCRLFLTPKQARNIQSEFNFTIQPFTEDDKTIDLDYSKTHFMAEFHISFVPKNTTKTQFKLLFHTIYEIFTTKIYEVLKIPELLYIHDAPDNQLHNRWSVGLIQQYAPPRMTLDGFQNARYLKEHGISGEGQVITIVDTGLDLNNAFFYDSQHPFTYDKLNPDHRKVVYYNSYGNAKDASSEGHGTHVAGTAAGKSICGNSMSLFDGAASDAKINFIDIGENENKKLLSMPIALLSTAVGLTNSYVISNSWGSSRSYGQSKLYDMAAYDLRDRLFVFSAGNVGDTGYMTINSPGDSKNVLTVGALGETYGQVFDSKGNYIMKIIVKTENDENTLDINQLSGESQYWTTKGIYQVETSLSPQENKVYITKEPESICQTTVPYAAIVLSSSKPSCQPNNFPVFQCVGSDDIFLNSKTVTISLTISEPFFNPAINLYSSKGPSYYGITKPDVVAPGENIKSASSKTSEDVHSCNINDLIVKTGTSMATPNVAGLALLVYQYFIDGNYIFNDKLTKEESSFVPGSSLVRAIIISSVNKLASTWEPNPIFGHGVPSIDNVLTFDKNLKVFKDLQIRQDEDMCLSFTLKGQKEASHYGNGRHLRIAMAYLDNPGYSDSAVLDIDLDMYLVTPSGRIIYGNQKAYNREEHLSTCEKIIFENSEIEIGKYELHIIGNGNIRYTVRRKQLFSLVISGPLDDSTLYDADTSTLEWKRSNYEDKCEFPTLGLHCQIKAEEIGLSAILPLIPIAESYFYFEPVPNWTNMTIVLTKPQLTKGKTVFQLSSSEKLYYRSYNYERTYSTEQPEYHIFLKRSDIRNKETDMISLRVVNLSPNTFNYTMEAIFDEFVPPVPEITKPVPTWKTVYFASIAVGYVLFAITLSILIVSIMIYIYKLRGYRAVSNAQDESLAV